jgi:hypothetical protein
MRHILERIIRYRGIFRLGICWGEEDKGMGLMEVQFKAFRRGCWSSNRY